MSSLNQISPITVYDPDDSEAESDDTARCLCCGKAMDYTGMCVGCAWQDCSAELGVRCKRTGAVDPLDYGVPETITDRLNE